MKNQKWILPALLVSGSVGLGYQPIRAQESGSSKAQSAASGQQRAARVSDADMRKVEEALKAKGYDPGPINGKLDKETQAALREFQKKNNLAVTGEVDKPTAEGLGVVIVITE